MTLDEVHQAIQGNVDNLRYARNAAFCVGMFKKGRPQDLYSLPFDDELEETPNDYDIEAFYNSAYKGGLN